MDRGGRGVDASIYPLGTIKPAAVAHQLAAHVRRWFVPLEATQAFVTDNPRNWSAYTYHESSHYLQGLTRQGIRRFVRGIFWGMGLGTDLCERLGGQDRVLKEAPAVVAQRLGGGIRLQQLSTGPQAHERPTNEWPPT